jgi:hypothetical protein
MRAQVCWNVIDSVEPLLWVLDGPTLEVTGHSARLNSSCSVVIMEFRIASVFKYLDRSILACDAIWSGRWFAVFRDRYRLNLQSRSESSWGFSSFIGL